MLLIVINYYSNYKSNKIILCLIYKKIQKISLLKPTNNRDQGEVGFWV